MNKLLTKIVGAALGVAMTVGVGVAVASNNKVEPVHADSSVTFAWTSFGINGTAASKTETTSGYSVTISSVSTQGVAKSGTINNTVALPGSITNLTVNGAKTGSTKTDGTFEVFGGTAANSITNKIDTVTGLSSTASNPSVDFSGSYSFFKIVVGTARTLIFTNISVSYSVSSTYSVTYNMNCDELVSGSVPTDSHAYSSSDNTVTVAGNTGNMSRGEKYEFVGWTINKDGSGTVYGPADGQTHTLDISNNTTFYFAVSSVLLFTIDINISKSL